MMRTSQSARSRSRGAPLVIASNRGPVEFDEGPDGAVYGRRGGGGLIAIVGPALASSGGVWVAAACSPTDRQVARIADRNNQLITVYLPQGAITVRSIDVDEDAFQIYYHRVATQTLWFLHHHLFDLARSPHFGPELRADWLAYEQVNGAFAAACADEVAPGGTVLLQDYHLAAAPALLRAQRRDVRIVHCTMCPWADPAYFATLPAWMARRLIDGMLGADLLSFFVPRWVKCFLRSCADLGYDVEWSSSSVGGSNGDATAVRAVPVGVDIDDLRAQLGGPRGQAESAAVRELVGDQRLILRVDRLEPAKNIVRGIAGFESFLAANPSERGSVLHYVLAYSSRVDTPDYQRYAAEVRHAVGAVNERFRTDTWEPVVLDTLNNFERGLALMARADVVVVNPLRDGMNLVAKEAAAVSANNAVVILSQHAGAADDLAVGALVINPFDTEELADAIATGLAMALAERSRRLMMLREAAGAIRPRDWLASLLAELDQIRPT